MNDPWEIQDDEATKWHARFNIFLGLGPDRSIDKAHAEYYRRQHNGSNPTAKRAPRTWMQESSDRHWVSRARAWDVHLQTQARKEHLERARNQQKALEMIAADAINKLARLAKAVSTEESVFHADYFRMVKDVTAISQQVYGESLTSAINPEGARLVEEEAVKDQRDEAWEEAMSPEKIAEVVRILNQVEGHSGPEPEPQLVSERNGSAIQAPGGVA